MARSRATLRNKPPVIKKYTNTGGPPGVMVIYLAVEVDLQYLGECWDDLADGASSAGQIVGAEIHQKAGS